MGFLDALRGIVCWNTDDAHKFATFDGMIIRDNNLQKLDIGQDISKSCLDTDVENAYDSFDPHDTIRYVMDTFFYDHSVIDRRHILAYAYVLICRVVKHQNARIPLSAINSIVCTSLIVSSKLLEDDHLCNGYWAKCLRFSDKNLDEQYSFERKKLATTILDDNRRKAELQHLEAMFMQLSLSCFNQQEEEFLKLCKFDLFVTASVIKTAELFLQSQSHVPTVLP